MPRPPPSVVDHFEAYRSQVSEISHARACFTSWLDSWAAGDDVVFDLTLALSELLANAIAASGEGETVLVCASRSAGCVALEVANRPGGSLGPSLTWDLADDLRGGGRGLLIIDTVVEDLHAEDRDGWTTVCCRRSCR